MAADAGIFGQYLQPVKSVAAYRADMDQEESNALKLAAGRMQAQQAQQDFADGQTLRTATMEAAGDQNALAKALNAKGLYKQAQAIQASIQGAEKTAAEIAKNKAQTGSAEAQTSAAKFKLEQEKRAAAATRMATFKTPDEAIADLQAKVQSGEVTPEQGDQLAQAIPRDAVQFGQWQLGHLRSLLTPQQLIEQGTAKPTEVNTGQQKYFVDNNPNSPTFGKQIGAAPVQLQASPEAVMTDERTRSEGAKNRGVQMRGQNMTGARAARTADQRVNPKPMPATALKMQQESLDAIGTASAINADLGAIESQIAEKKLSFGPVSNAISSARNAVGMSTEESRNMASFRTNLEKLRNDSLRLNKGVQTDGDAQRAWNELFQNINDTALVKQRLGEIKRLNDRAVQLRKMDVDGIRANYNQEPLNVDGYQNQPAALNGGKAGGSGGKTVNFGDLK